MGVKALLSLLLAVSTSFYAYGDTPKKNTRNEAQRRTFGELLRPPPPPPHAFRRPMWTSQRVQRQNFDIGYQYPPFPPPPPPPTNFKLPAPFSKPFGGYNYPPPPQPFFTTPSPGIFQKVSSWLFPNSENQVASTLSPFKNNCNPCNMFPWIPVIRYNSPQIDNPTYGPPSQISDVKQAYGPPNYNPAPPLSSPVPFYGPPTSTYSYSTINPTSAPSSPPISDVDIFDPLAPPPEYRPQLPKISIPTGFKNSYGEPITTTYTLSQTFDVPATAAESSKLKPDIALPDSSILQSLTNNTLGKIPKPSPFSKHQGRGIHTLQPVALPNLSASPLPPIFNARPFRVTTNTINNKYKNHQIDDGRGVNVVKSVPIAEYTASVEYPVQFTQSPLIEIDSNNANSTISSYRNENNFHTDANSQASEAHSSAISTQQENSFEGAGTGSENKFIEQLPPDFFEFKRIPDKTKSDVRQSTTKPVPNNIRSFAYGNDQDLQAIDSPILYLKPSAPHKDFRTFFNSSPITTTPAPAADFEIYDDFTYTTPDFGTTESWKAITFADFNSDLQPPPPYPGDVTEKPKILQIIIPYTSSNSQQGIYDSVQEWVPATEDYENLARKVPSFTEYPTTNPIETTTTTAMTPTFRDEEPVTRPYDILRVNTMKDDIYDVKEPPFDIISLQHNIDGWTEQEFANHYRRPQKSVTLSKLAHAKKIPDDYFTTPFPLTLFQSTSQYKTVYDHEFAGSAYHTKKQDVQSTTLLPLKNLLDQPSEKRSKELKLKPYIYTAASSFRLPSSSTQQPWGHIQTSISPLTKEKVYVVTAQPWRENQTSTDSATDSYSVGSDNFVFKSPRFSTRPSPLPSGKGESEDSYPFGKSWHKSINDLEGETFDKEVQNMTTASSSASGGSS